MTIWRLDIERVRVTGAGPQGMGAVELRALVVDAVERAMQSAALPNGRAAHAQVAIDVPSLSDGGAIAEAVARGVSQAVGGQRRG